MKPLYNSPKIRPPKHIRILNTAMSADFSRVDLVLQFALLIAGEEDERFDRQLGPIHLIKYVYLADLSYAQKNDGATYTGIKWRFHKFGPWSEEVNARIEPALSAINAAKESFPSDYEEDQDWTRWSLRDERLLEDKAQQLPSSVTVRLRPVVHEFGKDTSLLLDHVYETMPMLCAAPGEQLDFSIAQNVSSEEPASEPLRMDSLSNKKKKLLEQRLRELRKKYKNRQRKETPLVNPAPSPQYDDVYFEGLAWLDSLAGPPLSEGEYEVEFADEIWKSAARKGE